MPLSGKSKKPIQFFRLFERIIGAFVPLLIASFAGNALTRPSFGNDGEKVSSQFDPVLVYALLFALYLVAEALILKRYALRCTSRKKYFCTTILTYLIMAVLSAGFLAVGNMFVGFETTMNIYGYAFFLLRLVPYFGLPGEIASAVFMSGVYMAFSLIYAYITPAHKRWNRHHSQRLVSNL